MTLAFIIGLCPPTRYEAAHTTRTFSSGDENKARVRLSNGVPKCRDTRSAINALKATGVNLGSVVFGASPWWWSSSTSGMSSTCLASSVVEKTNSLDGADMGAKSIAAHFNDRGVTLRGQRWTRGRVHWVLSNVTYAGTYRFNCHDARNRRANRRWSGLPWRWRQSSTRARSHMRRHAGAAARRRRYRRASSAHLPC
jgi:hypothetical protein